MRNLGIFPFKPWPTHFFTLLLVAFFICPSVVSPSPLTFLPLLSILHWAVYILRTGSYVQLASSSSMLRPATHIFMTTTPISCLIDEYKKYTGCLLYLVLFEWAFHGFYHHSSGCLIPCKQTKFSEPGSWVTDFSLFESPFSLLHWVLVALVLSWTGSFFSPSFCFSFFLLVLLLFFQTDSLSILDITAPSNKHWLTIL